MFSSDAGAHVTLDNKVENALRAEGFSDQSSFHCYNQWRQRVLQGFLLGPFNAGAVLVEEVHVCLVMHLSMARRLIL
ncbi:hypothetical protein TIFTF001_002767 [Ficus carica]|uniref:Uncharacterized protein n=1 Tax=Ficus carica TaxID=3494 RepID=A0AA87ZWM4_FICCA|nr:hypothetical protein TIFTF001_002767 [Ficus carica]